MKRVGFLKVGSLVALAALAVVVGFLWGEHAPSTGAPVLPLSSLSTNPDVDPGTSLGKQPAPNFTLTNQFGESMSLSQFRGKVVLLAFTDSQCTTICPITTESLIQAVRMLGKNGSSVQLLGVNANPNATSVADVKSFSMVHGLLNSWNFLTGSPAQLARVWKAYGIYVAVRHGAIDHTPAVYLINQKGQEIALYDSQMAYASIGQQAHVLASRVAKLLPKSVSLPAMSYAYIPGVGPTTPTSLTTTSHKTVRLGPRHPHLLVFFATWLRQTGPLASNLETLNQYQILAHTRKWPSLVAIDEAPTEPSPKALPGFLGSLASPLTYPVAIDSTGQVADGYQVKNQPWLALTSTSGKILWSHDGWLPLSKIEATMAKYFPHS